MERMERLREFLNEWHTKAPSLKELTWDLYIHMKKEVEAYDAERNTH